MMIDFSRLPRWARRVITLVLGGPLLLANFLFFGAQAGAEAVVDQLDDMRRSWHRR